MYGGLGEGIEWLFKTMIALIIIFVPLGLWKAFELLSELMSHISWN